MGDQHRIDAQLIAKAGALQRWSKAENMPSSTLLEKLASARREGKSLWGLTVQPLGSYVRGQVLPLEIPPVQQRATVPVIQVETQPSPAEQPAPGMSVAQQLWEKYSRQNRGVMAAIAASNPQIQLTLDSELAKQAMQDGHAVGDIQKAISQHSPGAQHSPDAVGYAKAVVEKEFGNRQKQVQAASVSRSKPRSPQRSKARDNGYGY
ncbi:MAG: hypothetical protein HLUCCA11_24420 [Phormidesmis priestleyi Ana]|uniref:Uncharacterized protein n=1 Tax=Phormidesmis priestleyi Ana TaxID=1666911 RepID=A0A0N8KLJ2_9CYAN|nr:MAG: hypothetical protein HLUCCA11_24420 [Phormidesmis priestleyi Ana]